MLTAALLSLFSATAATPIHLAPPASSPALRSFQDEDVEAAIRARGEDVSALLALAAEYEEAKESASAKLVYKRVIELDPDNEDARTALRHQRYDGKWFESYVELAKYKREEAARMKEKGFVRFEEEWVPEADLPWLRMGWTKDEQQGWVDPVEVAREQQVAKWEAAGYQFRADDTSWIAPEDFDKWGAIQWKCGEEWLDMEAADAYHANPATPWMLTGEHFVVLTSCPWSYGNAARWHADQIHDELVRVFGVEPESPPAFLVLNSLDQYNTAAAGAMIDADGLSSLHGAYFSDGALDPSQEPPRFRGMGVCYWANKDPKMEAWGPFWLRWAAAQSFVDAIDPSWNAVSGRIAGGEGGDLQGYGVQFWSEKRIPRWLRYGAASYVERFLRNPEVPETGGEDADTWNLRSFAFEELKKNGGLRKLPEVFAFQIGLDDMASSTQMYYEAGLLVSFLLDGAPDDKELRKVHEAFRSALASGSKEDVAAAGKELEQALSKREKEIRKYAGL